MNCDYCDEIKGLSTIYNKIYGQRNRFVYETQNFFVFPCLGQLREGHLLIASKEHINAIGMLKENSIKELENIILIIRKFFREQYKSNLLCFEHGVLNNDGLNGGCGIYHMHLHLLPIRDHEFISVMNNIKNSKMNQIYPIPGLSSTRKYILDQKSYIFFAKYDDKQQPETYIVTNWKNYFESQYMRKIIGEVFEKKDWDWRQIKSEEQTFLLTLEKSFNYFIKYDRNFLSHTG